MSDVYYNDVEPFCQQVLKKNIERGNLPKGYVDGRDIRDVSATDLVGYQHIHLFAGIGAFPLGFERAGVSKHLRTITGGFPCQDISNAGKRAGLDGERSGLWREMFRLISGVRPDYIAVENVSALVNRGLATVLGDLASIGYDSEWRVIRASDFGAPHQRARVFIVAYPTGKGLQEWRQPGLTTSDTQATTGLDAQPQRRSKLAYTDSQRQQERNLTTGYPGMGQHTRNVETFRVSGQAQPGMGLVFNGLSPRLVQSYRWPTGPGQAQHEWEPPRVTTEKQANRGAMLKALGNAIVVPCCELVGMAINARENALIHALSQPGEVAHV